jgi:hypothetical protein
MKPDARERLARIETEARTLARSGNYRSFTSIKMLLLARGYLEAHKIFANRWAQFELDRLCQQAQDCCHEQARELGLDLKVTEPRIGGPRRRGPRLVNGR